MAVKISELPNLEVGDLTTVSSIVPVVANLGATITTYNTSMANVKTYVETGNLAVTGFITAQTDSSFGANVTIDGNLVVQGNTTVIGANNLGVTDNLIEIHLANAANVSEPWTYDDGRDIGVRMHYYKGTNDNAALFWDNTTRQLIWAESGVSESAANIGGGYTLGAVLTGSTIAANSTATTGNGTGALQSHGGAAVTGNLWVGGLSTLTGNITASGNLVIAQRVLATGNIVTPARMSTGNLNVNTFATVGTTLVAGGNTTVQALTVNGSATVGTTLGVTGNANVGGANVAGSATVGTTLGVGGNITGSGGISLVGSGTLENSLSASGGLQLTPIGNAAASTGDFTVVTTTGNTTIGGNLITTSIEPNANATYDIGAPTLQFVNVYAFSTRALYADLAELYIPDQTYDPGTVVVFGGEQEITVTTTAEDTRVAGAISTEPAYVMNSGENQGLPVALRGKVPVKVIGKVNKGDLLVTSEIAGYARAAKFTDPKPYSVFAKSLESNWDDKPRVIWAVIV